jgi:hypothetical protein
LIQVKNVTEKPQLLSIYFFSMSTITTAMNEPFSGKTGIKNLTEYQASIIRRAYRHTTDEALAEMLQTSQRTIYEFRRLHRLLRDIGAPGVRSTKIAIPRPPTSLCLHDLKEVYQLCRQGKDTWAICLHFNITMDHCLECIAAAELVHGKNQPPLTIQVNDLQRAEPVKHSATPATYLQPAAVKFTRPKAEYSNRSPYGVARPGLSR